MSARYKITAATGNVSEDSVEVLGEAYRTVYETRADAEAAKAQLDADRADNGYDDVTYTVVEIASDPASAAARAVSALEAIPSRGIQEAHQSADSILVAFLHEAGFIGVADAYRDAEKRTTHNTGWWYA